jgi:hypothetical protein
LVEMLRCAAEVWAGQDAIQTLETVR